MKTMKRLGWGSGVGAIVALVSGGLAGCGSDFSNDCQATRTCAADDNQGGDNAGGADDGVSAGVGGQLAGGAGGDSTSAGAGGDNLAGAGGSEDSAAGAGGAPVVNDPPAVVAITPADATADAEPNTEIVIELSEPLDEETVTADNVRIWDGGEQVSGQLSYADSKITFVPAKPLALLASYEVELSTAVADLEGAGLAEAFGSGFAVRDGAWLIKTVEAGAITVAPREVQMNRDGRALLAWSGATSEHCPTSARWFERGALVGDLKTFGYAQNQYCLDVHSSVSPNGQALITWFEQDNQGQSVVTTEFRNGKWGAATLRSNDNFNSAVAASDDGVMHFIGAGSDVQVWQTSPLGVWSTKSKQLSPQRPNGGAQIAVAKNGDAVAAWLDMDASLRDRVLVATYSKKTDTWSDGVVLPGSLSGANAANRGMPAVAFDAASVPLVVWKRASDIVASRFDAAQAVWAGYVTVASLGDNASTEVPSVVFDGQTFVVAYTATKANVATPNVVRYDQVAEAWGTPIPLATPQTKAASRMPRLTADAHSNLLVLWPSVVGTGAYTLAYERFDATAQTWVGAKLIPDATINDANFNSEAGRWALGGAPNGLAVATFADAPDWPSNLRIASFH